MYCQDRHPDSYWSRRTALGSSPVRRGRQRLRRRRHKPVRNIEETYKADEVEVTDNGIDWSNAKKLPTASIDLAKVKAYAEENKDLLSCLVYKTAEFTPEKESGSIDMDYTFNSNDVIDRLSGETKNLVVFEVMFKGSIENASDETPVSIVASECDKDNEDRR